MTIEERLEATSYLLGKAHGGITFILMGYENECDKLIKLHKLKEDLDKEVGELFYANSPHSPS